MKHRLWFLVLAVGVTGCFDSGTSGDGNNNPVSGSPDEEIALVNDSLKGTWDLCDSTGSIQMPGALVVTDSMFGIYSGHPTMWKLIADQGQVYLDPFSSSGTNEYYYDYTLADGGLTMYLLAENTDVYTQPSASTGNVLIYKKQTQ